MKNFALYIFLIASSLLLFSCNAEDNSVAGNGKPVLLKVDSSYTFPSDTITFYGSFFGSINPNSFFKFNDSIIVKSNQCLSWNDSKIKLIIGDSLKSGKLFLYIDSILIDSANINIANTPPYNTKEIEVSKFSMGSLYGLDDELPINEITLSKNLIVSTCEIHQRLFEFVMKTNPSILKSDNFPVYNIDWIDAIKFCNKLSTIDGFDLYYNINETTNEVQINQNAKGWRLPTEAEWEYLAKSGNDNDFPGNEISNYSWNSSNSGMMPHSIATKLPNQFGIYDMNGNVAEWCWDYYKSDYYKNIEDSDPIGPNIGNKRVARGGSFVDSKLALRNSSRNPNQIKETIGFRIVRNK